MNKKTETINIRNFLSKIPENNNNEEKETPLLMEKQNSIETNNKTSPSPTEPYINNNNVFIYTAIPLLITGIFLLITTVLSLIEVLELSKEFINVEKYLYAWGIINLVLFCSLVLTIIIVSIITRKKRTKKEKSYIAKYNTFIICFLILIVGVIIFSSKFVNNYKEKTKLDIETSILSSDNVTDNLLNYKKLAEYNEIFIFNTIGNIFQIFVLINTFFGLKKIN